MTKDSSIVLRYQKMDYGVQSTARDSSLGMVVPGCCKLANSSVGTPYSVLPVLPVALERGLEQSVQEHPPGAQGA